MEAVPCVSQSLHTQSLLMKGLTRKLRTPVPASQHHTHVCERMKGHVICSPQHPSPLAYSPTCPALARQLCARRLSSSCRGDGHSCGGGPLGSLTLQSGWPAPWRPMHVWALTPSCTRYPPA